LNQKINIALQDQKVRGSLLDMGIVIKGGSPNDFRVFLKSETDKWAAIIRTANIKAD
jgi:tripartite-type tricarboxylate transporter receptor subunit TctC